MRTPKYGDVWQHPVHSYLYGVVTKSGLVWTASHNHDEEYFKDKAENTVSQDFLYSISKACGTFKYNVFTCTWED